MKSKVAIVFFILCSFNSGALGGLFQPCKGNHFSCVAEYLGPYVVPFNSVGGQFYDTAFAEDVLVEYIAFNFTLYRPSMKIHGLNQAKIVKFGIDEKLGQLLVSVYFPKIKVSGESQSFYFHKACHLDTVVDSGPFEVTLEEIYVTTMYEYIDGQVDPNSGRTYSQWNVIPYVTYPALEAAEKKYSLVKNTLYYTRSNRDILAREYIFSIGKVLYEAYLSRNKQQDF